MLKIGMPPVARADARVLILGSLPGDASLAAAQYYAHPRNQFWWLLGNVIDQDLVSMSYAVRIEALYSAGIALWDVVATAERPGSLDRHIRNVDCNELRSFICDLPLLEVIAFNGKKAAALAGNVFTALPVDTVCLPSSSPAYALNIEAKATEWAALTLYSPTPVSASHAKSVLGE